MVATCKSEWPDLYSLEWTLNFRIKILSKLGTTAGASKQKAQNGSVFHILSEKYYAESTNLFFKQNSDIKHQENLRKWDFSKSQEKTLSLQETTRFCQKKTQTI